MESQPHDERRMSGILKAPTLKQSQHVHPPAEHVKFDKVIVAEIDDTNDDNNQNDQQAVTNNNNNN